MIVIDIILLKYGRATCPIVNQAIEINGIGRWSLILSVIDKII